MNPMVSTCCLPATNWGQHDFSRLPKCWALGGEFGDAIYDISNIIFETKFHFFQYHHDLGLTWKAVAIGVGADNGNATEDETERGMPGCWWMWWWWVWWVGHVERKTGLVTTFGGIDVWCVYIYIYWEIPRCVWALYKFCLEMSSSPTLKEATLRGWQL